MKIYNHPALFEIEESKGDIRLAFAIKLIMCAKHCARDGIPRNEGSITWKLFARLSQLLALSIHNA
jgi:hypothetical protein